MVSGGTGGIGGAVCRLLAARGSRVLLTYRTNHEQAEAVVAAAPGLMAAVQADLSDQKPAQSVVDAALGQFGGVHTFVHAAGITVPQAYLSEIDSPLLERHMVAEVVGFFNMVSPLLPCLRTSRGSIVAITTVATQRFPARDALSSGPKAAVEAVVRALAVEEGRYGVRANSVGPGIIGEGMTERLIASGDMDERALSAARDRIPLGHFGSAEDIAEAACFLASPSAAYITGQRIGVDGGYAT